MTEIVFVKGIQLTAHGAVHGYDVDNGLSRTLCGRSYLGCNRERDGNLVTCRGCVRVVESRKSWGASVVFVVNTDAVGAEVTNAELAGIPDSEVIADLYERARFLGCSEGAAARVADCLKNYDMVSDPCPKHPNHSTTMRNGYAVDGCEACEVIELSGDAGYSPEVWARILADRAAETARILAEESMPLEDTREFKITMASLVRSSGRIAKDGVSEDGGRDMDHIRHAVTLGLVSAPQRGWVWGEFLHPSIELSVSIKKCVSCRSAEHVRCELVCRCRCEGRGDFKTPSRAIWHDIVNKATATEVGRARVQEILRTVSMPEGADDVDAYFNACRAAYRLAEVMEASAAVLASETREEIAARHKAEHFKVGDPYRFSTTTGYKLYQNRPMACRLSCACGTCNGVTTVTEQIISDVAWYVSGGLELSGHLGGHAIIRVDRLD